MSKLQNDEVNHPSHYNQGGMEAIEIIKLALTPEEFRGFLMGNALKYKLRYKHKGAPEKDLRKANWYTDYLARIVAEQQLITHNPRRKK